MKKMTVLVAAVLCMLFSIPINADEDATYEELQSYEEDILISANSIIPDESIQASDLDYDKTIKVYENVDLFSYSEIDNEIIEEAIIGKEYIYLIPVYKNNKMSPPAVIGH